MRYTYSYYKYERELAKEHEDEFGPVSGPNVFDYLWTLFLISPLRQRWTFHLVCKPFGHDLVDEGHAGPESGCISMECRRCGYSYPTVWLY